MRMQLEFSTIHRLTQACPLVCHFQLSRLHYIGVHVVFGDAHCREVSQRGRSADQYPQPIQFL